MRDDSNTPSPAQRRRSSSIRISNLSWSQWLWHRTFEDCCDFTPRTRTGNNTESNDECHDKAPPPSPPVSVPEFLIFFFSKLLLEVCGAAGAVWGFCEILDWRRVENTDDFRGAVTVAFAVFACRFYWHAKHFWQHGYEFPYPKLRHRRSHWFHGLQVFGSKFVLQVMGAAGAVWGASETTGLRNARNRESWRAAAWVTTVLFAARWYLQLFSYCLVCERHRRNTMKVLMNVAVPFVEVTIVKFVLEVCGSTGAVWGFADILTIRDQNPDSAKGWRIVALVIGSIFWARWMRQLLEYLRLGQESPLVTEPQHTTTTVTSVKSEDENEEEDDDETEILIDQQDSNYTRYGSTTTTKTDHEIVVSE